MKALNNSRKREAQLLSRLSYIVCCARRITHENAQDVAEEIRRVAIGECAICRHPMHQVSGRSCKEPDRWGEACGCTTPLSRRVAEWRKAAERR